VSRSLEKARARFARGDRAGAERHLRAALAHQPNDPDALHLAGLLHLGRHEHGAAIAALRRAVALRTPFPEAMLDLSVACNRTGEHELARQLCELLLTLSPNAPAACINLGMAWKGLGRLPEAKRAFEAAGDHPMARFNLGHTLLLEGDLEGGLPLLEARRALLGTGRGLSGAPWAGDARPEATLLVIPEQGLGDVLLASRFFVPLLSRFARVVVHAPASLRRLLATLDPRLEVVTALEGVRWDLWAPVMSLPHLLGVRSLEALPVGPWLHVAPGEAPGARPRVGINWAGNPSYAYDAVRSTSLGTLAPLLAIRDVEWLSLHRGARETEAAAMNLAQPLAGARDFLDTARVVASLDLVISTETAIPNLSGAMGVPTCVLTVRDADWRWRGWYADVTVCDQDAPGNWFGPIAKAARAIQRLLEARAAA